MKIVRKNLEEERDGKKKTWLKNIEDVLRMMQHCGWCYANGRTRQ